MVAIGSRQTAQTCMILAVAASRTESCTRRNVHAVPPDFNALIPPRV